MKRIYFAALACFMAIGIMVAISYAWFINSEFVEPDISGYSISAYFGGGDGSSEDPYEIKNPRHLYNLAWLQYLGYFNQPGSGNTPDENNTTTLTQYSFVIDNNLNMDGWYLPPIGTSYNPFIGVLNGNGYTISNLNTTNNFSDFGQRHPGTVTSSNFANAEIIGFIGAVGEIDTMNHYGYTISSSANAIANIKLKDTTVKTSTSQSLIGIAAGYINGLVQDVGIVRGNLNITAGTKLENMDNISDYTVAGYAESDYVTRISTTKAMVLNPSNTYKTSFVFEDEGNITGWGGSIAMQDMYDRILSARPYSASNTRPNDALTYVKYENRYINIDGKSTIQETKTQNSSNYDTLQADIFVGTNAGGANGYYLKRSVSNGNTYNYLTGLYKDVAIIEKTNNIENGYKIKSSTGNYLNFESTSIQDTVSFNINISSNTNSSSATVWIRESKSGSTYSLYTYSEDDGYKYYLTTTDYETLSLSTSDNTSWKYDSNYGFYVTYNNTNYYIRYISGNWVVSNQRAYYITDGYNNYLSRNNDTITNSTSLSNATRWIFSDESTKSGIIYDESNTNYKLYINNGNLTVSTTNSTNWTNSNNLLYNGSYIIIFDQNWTLYTQNQFYINYNGTYLSLNNDGSINNNVTNETDATIWTFSDTNGYPKGYISTVINGTTYYLRYNNGLTTTTSTNNRTNWANDGTGLNSNSYYIQYVNNQWIASQRTLSGYYISSGNNYLYNQNVFFNIDSNNRLYYTYQGSTIYVTITRSGSMWAGYTYSIGDATSASADGVVIKNGNTFYTTYSSFFSTTTVYLNYNNGWTASTSSQNLTWTPYYDIKIPTLNSLNLNYQSTTLLVSNVVSLESSTTYKITREVKTEPSVFNYIPLNAIKTSPYTVDEMNTGYLISGSHELGSGQYADIRVSQYAISNVSQSYSNGSWVNNGIRTYGANGNDYIGSNSYPLTMFSKYKESKDRLSATLGTNSYVYGLHFMNSAINIEHLVVAPQALINGETKYNYQMPEDCIDFHLASKGIINFFAGYYFPGNTTFFSLHEIIRDDDDNITAIKHITSIYKANSNYGSNYLSADYIYEYADGTYSGQYSSNKYDLVFSASWIETPNVNANNYGKTIFYFEIPVNKGEFALGSVEGGDGAYLIYLDIGANAQEVDRTEINQKSVVTQYDYIYPNGIAVITENTTIDTSISTVSLDASSSAVTRVNSTGTIALERTAADIINVTTAMNIISTYISKNISLTKNSSAMNASAIKTTTSIYSQIQYIDHNLTSGEVYETNIERVVTTTTILGESPVTTTYNPTVKIFDYLENEEIDITSNDAPWKLYGIVIDDSGSNKNRSFALSTTQDNSDGKASERLALYNSLLATLETINSSTETSILEYEFETFTPSTNTYSIHINTTLDTSNNLVRYYDFAGNDITVTTDNNSGTIVYVTNDNTTYVFVINGTTITDQVRTVTVTAS